MKRKEFLQRTGYAAMGVGLLGYSCKSKSSDKFNPLKNWAGNIKYGSREVLYPQSLEEVQSAVKNMSAGKALGSQHSFSLIADTSGTHLSTSRLEKVLGLDEGNEMVWCEAGVRYGTLATWLEERGKALHNLASLPHISVAGACATATHGSGDGCGNLASAVRKLELVNGLGEVVTLDTAHPDFYGAVVNLGGLGVVTKVGLAVENSFEVTQNVYEDLSMDVLSENFEKIFGAGYSVSLFTHWLDRKINQVWIKRRTDRSYESLTDNFFGAIAATTHLHPIKVNSPVNCTEQMGSSGKWFERLPHFKMGFMPSNGEELQTEFFVSRTHAVQAIMAIESLHKNVSPALFVTEIRSVAADQLWMSPAYGRDVIAIHFTWKPEPEKVFPLIPQIEELLKPFNPVPHWGKISTLSADYLSDRYSRLNDFKRLIDRYDPAGKFRNAYLNEKIFGERV